MYNRTLVHRWDASSLQPIQLLLVVIEARVAPVVPSDALDGRVSERGGQQRAAPPASSRGGARKLPKRGPHKRLEPGRVGAHVRGGDATHELSLTVSGVGRVEGSVVSHV
eukprot:scaffold26257_cov63-Phaeocystis_antarctica.AAC.7